MILVSILMTVIGLWHSKKVQKGIKNNVKINFNTKFNTIKASHSKGLTLVLL